MKKVHFIGNAHLDPVWLWRWQEGFSEIKATFQSALHRMEEFPDYKFTAACACYYEWVEENEPSLFEEIKKRVSEGRWVITGGWYIQPDCNLPAGESFARQGLYSQNYFQEKFGKMAVTGYNVDSFGHNGMLPQILKKSGMDSYVFMRPMKYEKELSENLFIWESPDGSQVPTFRIPLQYNNRPDEYNRIMEISELAQNENIDYMAFYGVGNHGGGATIEQLKFMGELINNEPEKWCFSSPDEYFEAVKGSQMPILKDELQHHARGCYSTHSISKMYNRRSEHSLMTAEKFSVIAGIEYPFDSLKRGWKDVMFNQFHDILGGCSLKEAMEDAVQLYGEALSIADREINFSLQKISWNIDTSCGLDTPRLAEKEWNLWVADKVGTPYVVFNPLSWEVDTTIACGADMKFITDEEGNVVEFQRIRASQTNNEDSWQTLFRAKIPAFGHRVYRLHKYETDKIIPEFCGLTASDTSMENEFLRLTVDKRGNIGLYDKINEIDLFADKGAVARVIDEEVCDTWAHDYFFFQDEVGVFLNADARLIENGPVRAIIRVTSRYNNSILRQDFILNKNESKIDVNVKLSWNEPHRMLKISFPVNVENPEVTAEIPFGYIKRNITGEEETCLQWVDMTGEKDGKAYGVAILNNGKYAYDAKDNMLSITAVRSPIFADHFGVRDEFCEHMDIGIHEFSYAICPHMGKDSYADLTKRAYELNVKPKAILETFHKGDLPEKRAGISVSCDNVIVSALKMAENKKGHVIRAYETAGKTAETVIKALGREIKTCFTPFEIKTLFIPLSESETVYETNLIEK